MTDRSRLLMFVSGGLLVAATLALVVGPYASSSPDGLERVAIDREFIDTATEHAAAGGPLADYGVAGVEDPRWSTGAAGLIGVVVCFALALLAMLALRRGSRVAARSNSRSDT